MPVSIETAAAIASKFYTDHPEILCCEDNSEKLGQWMKQSGLAFSARNLEEALTALADQLALKYSDEAVQRMTGDQYKRLVLPYRDDLSKAHRDQLKPRTPDPIDLLSSAEIRDQLVIPEWKAAQAAKSNSANN